VFDLPRLFVVTPTNTGRVDVSGSSMRYWLNAAGGTVTLTGDDGPSGHEHTSTVPAHTHGQDFGIFEDVGNPSFTLRRSDNAVDYEFFDFFSNDPSGSRFDIDLDSDNFFTNGFGAGLKSIRFTSAGGQSGRTRIIGQIQIKVDITA